jgi:hypothetical protein
MPDVEPCGNSSRPVVVPPLSIADDGTVIGGFSKVYKAQASDEETVGDAGGPVPNNCHGGNCVAGCAGH